MSPHDRRRVLGQLRRHPGATTAELAAHAGLSPLTTSQALVALRRQGRATWTATPNGGPNGVGLHRWWPR